MVENKYITAIGISYRGTLPKIKKVDNHLQAVYEAFTNSMEAIKMSGNSAKGQVTIRIKLIKSMFSNEEQHLDFDCIEIEDNGIGFNDAEFERLENLNDDRKGFLNKGSGRVQFLHYFDRTEYKSTFKDEKSETGFSERIFTLSKGEAFLNHNAIVHYESVLDAVANDCKTIVTFRSPLSAKDTDFFKTLKLDVLKRMLINRYLADFCENRNNLPMLKLERVVSDVLFSELQILANDIPKIDKTLNIEIHYSRVSPDGKIIEKTENKETLNLKTFKIPKEELHRNDIFLVSKGEAATELKLESLSHDDHINGNRYLFLLSGKYIDERDSDNRGHLRILTEDEFKKSFGESNLFPQEEILKDDIQETTNNTILGIYQEIRDKNKEKDLEIERLKAMFLLNPETVKDAKIKLSDSEERILEKVYQADAKAIAKKDAEIKRRIDALDKLDPASEEFRQSLDEEINALTKVIPLQNKVALIHYVARRKLVLQLFSKVLERKLDVQKTSDRSADEKLIHNILFQQSSNDPDKSDLWIINEDFIYFSGVSEITLSNVKINGKKLFKKKFSEEEETYLKSLGENRKIKRPDILLFPAEGKCIIIEFKDPTVNVSVHLSQTDYYAYLIRNYTIDEIQINTFYGYLLGEAIEARDVRGHVSAYEESYHFDYLFRPSTKVVGEKPRTDGSIYSEVIKFSTLISRAEQRNDIFIKKLTT